MKCTRTHVLNDKSEVLYRLTQSIYDAIYCVTRMVRLAGKEVTENWWSTWSSGQLSIEFLFMTSWGCE